MIAGIVSSCFSVTDTASVADYNAYVAQFNKSYDTPSFWQHYFQYQHKLEDIAQHNAMNTSWNMGVNQFTDMSEDEFKHVYLRASPVAADAHGSFFTRPNMSTVPDAIDWRSENLVTNVKDQGACGSCWAFSAIGALEGAHARKTGMLTQLSEQNLVDCASRFGCHGCEGGWMNSALEYVHYNNGVDTEAAYAYTATDGTCRYTTETVGARVTSVQNISAGDTDSLVYAVATVGPISVAIDAEFDFQNYQSGIYTSSRCSAASLDHGVLIVGYGVTSKGRKYYIIKNSWGSSWGMNGYAYWDRDIPDMCGIAQAASFPVL